ncbi:hypothetical protein [Paenibacillus radicibacter]|uniref:hypothetical protein n=1 Tax=Paenibacillus radicibacter TaxID=2972488 RepID=UPI002158A9B8|nr:hypothetical protein [Paenibacillus radicibacter]
MNLNRACARSVTVQVFDWSSGSPVPLLVSPCGTKKCTVRVEPNQSVFLFSDVSKVVFKYEVRITQVDDPRLITNVTGVTKVAFTPQTGDTVLQSNLIRIR